MEERARKRRGGEEERKEKRIASSNTNQMTRSSEEYLRKISKCMNELKQTITDDTRTAKAIKTYANQKTEEMIQLIIQMNNEMQDERQEMQNERQEMQDERQKMQDERQKMQDERQKMQDEIQEMQNKLIKEESRSARLQSAVHILKEEIRSTPTYTSVTKSSKQVQRTICNASKKHVLFVQNNNKDKTSKEIKDELTNKINPKTDKIKIKAIRQTRANSIIMEFDTRSDLQKFKDHPKFTTLKIEEPRKRKPLMIIYDVDSSLTASELKESIKHQNLDELSIEREDIIIPRFKTGPRDKPTVHWVI
ncbi:hypothetical protein HN011_005232 [Eciton burchellii]|nr:hypothetical protein HN011_005232 [Eciton burchellii]